MLARDDGADFRDSAAGDQPAAGQDDDAIGERFGFLEIVGREDNRTALRDHRADGPPHRLARVDVEADGRLVEEEQRRPAANRQRELHLPFLAGGELRVGPVGERLGARQLERLLHGQWIRVVAGGELDQFANAELRGQPDFLHHHADVPPALDVERRAAEQRHRSRVGLEQPEPERDRR